MEVNNFYIIVQETDEMIKHTPPKKTKWKDMNARLR